MAHRLDQNELNAESVAVEKLVHQGRRGVIRIPEFQRDLKWDDKDVAALFDSIHRRYPIGTLLLQERPASSQSFSIGHVLVRAEAMERALFVVDGQQRMTSLIAGLVPGKDGKRAYPYNVYFNWEDQEFTVPKNEDSLAEPWIRVDRLLDATALSMLFAESPLSRLGREERQRIFDAGARLREYKVPQYVLSTQDEEELKRIFFRVNTAGKKMDWSDVQKALFGRQGNEPSTAAAVVEQAAKLGMGEPELSNLQSTMLTVTGLDPAKKYTDYVGSHEALLRDAGPKTANALSRAIVFLRDDSWVPHLRLVPHWSAVTVLSRFFAFHPEPTERTRIRLRRWLWRGGLQERVERRALLRACIRLIDGATNEEDSISSLMRLLPAATSPQWDLGSRFDARSASTREYMLGLAALRPLSLDGTAIDIAATINERGLLAFVPLVKARAATPENRVLGLGSIDSERWSLVPGEVLRSHGMDRRMAQELAVGNYELALRLRREFVEEHIRATFRSRSEWDQVDRPSIGSLMSSPEANDAA